MPIDQGLLTVSCAVAGGIAGAFVPEWVARLPAPAAEDEADIGVPESNGPPSTGTPGTEGPESAELSEGTEEPGTSEGPESATTPGTAEEPALGDGPEPIPYPELARRRGLRVFASTAAAAGCAALGWRVGWHPALPTLLYLAVVGVVLTYVDIRVQLLPNAIVLPSYPVVIALLAVAAVVTGEWTAFARALASGAVLWTLFAVPLLFRFAGMGYGDVKLVGLLGMPVGWFGVSEVLVGLFLAFCLGGIVALVLVLLRRAHRKTPIPFGPFLIVGFLTATAL